MADQLSIYNAALAHLGSRRIADLGEPREPTRVLNDEWQLAVTWALELGPWQFATRLARIVNDGSPIPNGFAAALPKPGDWIKTVDIAIDAGLSAPLVQYAEEGNYWYCDTGVIYVRYVSADGSYGFQPNRWPPAFSDLVALRLAERACRRITGSTEMLSGIVQMRQEMQREALTVEEQNAARTFPRPSAAIQSQLQIYNNALGYLGRSRIVSLTQTTDTVRELNDQWLGQVYWCLQQAPWQFATKILATAAVDQNTQDEFNARYYKPDDWVMTLDLAIDARFATPVTDFVDEGRYWKLSAGTGLLYVRYISATGDAGFNLSLWPPSFADLLSARLAEVSAGRLGAGDQAEALTKRRLMVQEEAQRIESERAARTIGTDPATETRKQIYNDALAHIGAGRVASLTETNETVRTLNDQYAVCVRWCLQQAPWAFATRQVVLATAALPAPTSGFARSATKPIDWVTTLDLAQDDALHVPLGDYGDEGRSWLTQQPRIVARYISADAAYGMDPTKWPPLFADLLALRLAEKCCLRLKGDKDLLAGIVKMRDAAAMAAEAEEAAVSARVYVTPEPLAAVRLEIMNDALAHLGRPRLVSLTQARADLRDLNDRWDATVRWALQQAPWTFATRTALLASVPNVAIPPGFVAAYQKPYDWLKTVSLMASGDFRDPLVHYFDADAVWYTRTHNGLAVRYISSDSDWGLAMAAWPASFRSLLSARLAEQICPRSGPAASRLGDIITLRQQAMKEARANDALNTEVAFAPRGSWVRTRIGREWGDGGLSLPTGPLAGDTTTSVGATSGYAGAGADIGPHDGAGLAGATDRRAGTIRESAGAEPILPSDQSR